MKIRVLGCSGGVQPDSFTTSFLIDENVLIDAGAVCATLPLEDQYKLDYVLVTHTHLDHIKDLAFLADNLCGVRVNPLVIYGSQGTISALREHFFNNIIWPDFTQIPSKEQPILQLRVIPSNGSVTDIGGYLVQAIPVNHLPNSVGYVVTKGDRSVIFTGDTAATQDLWKVARETKALKAIFSEISFPSTMLELAELSKHFCPLTFEKELDKLEGIDVPVYVGHFKPGLEDVLTREFKSRNLGARGVHILKQGAKFRF